MLIKRTISACIISCILISSTMTVHASEVNTNIVEEQTQELENVVELPDMNTQIEGLYNQIGTSLNMNPSYIKILHLLAGGKAIYAEQKPNIYNDITVTNLQEPMYIEGTNTVYQKAQFIICNDDKIARPSAYYLPDAIYSVAYDIASLMGQRYTMNRAGMQVYFDSLKDQVKINIVFCEAVMIYLGEDVNTVDNFYKTYEKIMYDKQSNENVIETLENGQLKFKDKFLNTLNDMGIVNENTINKLAIILSFDANLAINTNIESVKNTYIVPYKINYTSRENMMLAAMSLTGKVRYVWGGGHSGASHINGINPVWSMWESLYKDTPSSDIIDEEGNITTVQNIGFGTCIKPSSSWCPIHGYSSGECNKSELITSLDQYIQLRKDIFSNTDELTSDKYRELLSTVDYTEGISVHTLDGLDCSGFASWLYNQVTDKYEINSTAMYFTQQNGLIEVPFGESLLPGDVFAWTTHIVVVVGKVKENSKAYVTIEQTPNVLKFGVLYYSGATSSDINQAKQIAREANQLIGGLNIYEEPHVYCMNNVGKYTEEAPIGEIATYDNADSITETESEPESVEITTTDIIDGAVLNTEMTEESLDSFIEVNENTTEEQKTVTITKQYYSIGRFKDEFIDDNIPMGEDGIPIKDMTAQEIIQYILTKLPISYITGYNQYMGNIFDKTKASSNLGIDIQTYKE